MNEPELPESEVLAAEFVLGLLDAEARLQARGLMGSDAAFAASVARWEDRLAPLLDGIAPVAPGGDIWARIQAALDRSELTGEPVVEVLTLRRRVRQWKIATGFAAAAAVVLAFLALPMTRSPDPAAIPEQQIAAADPLVASIPIGETPLRLGVTYLPDREEMLVSASGLTADGVHDHELWLVTPDEGAKSLGVVVPGEERRMTVDAALARRIQDGAELVLTREPLGGAAPGTDAGPMVASGTLHAART